MQSKVAVDLVLVVDTAASAGGGPRRCTVVKWLSLDALNVRADACTSIVVALDEDGTSFPSRSGRRSRSLLHVSLVALACIALAYSTSLSARRSLDVDCCRLTCRSLRAEPPTVASVAHLAPRCWLIQQYNRIAVLLMDERTSFRCCCSGDARRVWL